MRKYIYISIGGVLGALLRFAIKNIQIVHYQGSFPLNTLLINITGSFILALFLTTALEKPDFDEDIRLGVSTGFFGAFTTFSSFCRESVLLMAGGEYFLAAVYILLSSALGLAAIYLGVALAKMILAKRTTDRSEKEMIEITDEAGVE